MRLVHCSDFHLGYRQFSAETGAGINQREADVFATFRTLIDRIIALAPDLVVIGGDVFHSVRPGNNSVIGACREFARLVTALPSTIIVLVAGNHDMPKASKDGCILPILSMFGIHVIDTASRRLEFPALELSVLGVPDAPGVARPELTPDPRFRFNVLVMHGEVQGMLNAKAMKGERPSVEIAQDEIAPARWDYVALGHYHVYRELAPNMFYSGSIDYTSTNPWGELAEQTAAGLAGKGFAERDLVTGVQTFHPLPASRRYVDLGAIDASGMAPDDVDAAMRAAVDGCPGGFDGAIARLVAHGVTSDVAHALDHRAIRQFKSRAMHFDFDWRKPDVVRLGSIIGPALKQGLSLDTIVGDRLRARVIATDVDREAFTGAAERYMGLAAEKMADGVAAETLVAEVDETIAQRKAS